MRSIETKHKLGFGDDSVFIGDFPVAIDCSDEVSKDVEAKNSIDEDAELGTDFHVAYPKGNGVYLIMMRSIQKKSKKAWSNCWERL